MSDAELLKSFERMITSGEGGSFANRLSHATRLELQIGENNDMNGEFANYVVQHCKDEAPFIIIGVESEHDERTIRFAGKAIEGTFQFQFDNGEWRIDLWRSARRWKELKQWSEDVTPLLDRDGREPLVDATPFPSGSEAIDSHRSSWVLDLQDTADTILGFTRRTSSRAKSRSAEIQQ